MNTFFQFGIICLISFFVIASNTYASLYSCTSLNSTPELIQTTDESYEVKYNSTSAFWLENTITKNKQNNKKKPFLIYYAVDSKEPFMQISVRQEITALQLKCEDSNDVNFVAAINSLYLERNEILVCKNRLLENINLNKYPNLDDQLKKKHAQILEGDHTTSDLGIFRYLVKYESNARKSFNNFPLAHPDFLYDLINFFISEKTLFPTVHYMPFLHLKSHGSKQTVLSGLYQCQQDAKVRTQTDIISKVLSIEDIEILKSLDTFEKMKYNFNLFNKITNKLHLGDLINSSSEQMVSLNGKYNLGIFSNSGNLNNNASDAIFALGASDQAFGLHHITLNAVLAELFNNKNKRVLGFLMLESCDTNKQSTFSHKYLENVFGFYSATNSLWYRNLNWGSLLEDSGGSIPKLIDGIEASTSKIKNIQIINDQI